MDIKLKYGSGSIMLNLPDGTLIPEYREPEYEIDKERFVHDIQKLLPDESSKYSNIAIVISDKTRLCGYPEFLPWLLEVLNSRGAKKENITFYIAYGTHARQTDDESFKSYGAVYKEYRFVHHDCTDVSAMVFCGTTSRGTPVTIRRDILDSSLLITFGSISHHYFAGYGGGRKLLFPGLALKEAVYHNHGLFLDLKNRTLAKGCQPGNLDGNPLAEDLKEIDSFMPQKISVHGILNSSGKVCRLIIGSSYNDFRAACSVHDGYFRYPGKEMYDLVIASGGGYPKDINFIQAHKSVHHSAAFVKDGGTLIVLAECIDKIGSNYFMKYLEAGGFEQAFAILEKHYEGNGGTALSMMLKTRRIKIYMLTSLDEATCKTLGVKKINEADTSKIIHDQKGTIAVIKNASMLVKQL